ncbi:hypothetical protein HPB49_021224 [Dermacentor silvarum]|uniref:Uncharacterized protein n=1 Tax=Dermacentor silvarum TaxID=543639 RepID=A0ACB8CN08_DERSI|nr:hypothetical protein HPB49_021224 [Dermacentor silvarum]
MLLRWAYLHCPQARFVVKIDDDCFSNLANIYRIVHGQPEDAIYGELLHKHIPSRDPLDKWHVPYEELPADVFPD